MTSRTAAVYDKDQYEHMKVSLDLVASLPCFAVRVPPGQKDPGHYGWDPKTNSAEKSLQTIDTVKRSLANETPDNFGVHIFGSVVDVDIDTDDIYTNMALDYFLPPTSHIWGRDSRPRTHRLYLLSASNGSKFSQKDHRFLEAIQAHEFLEMEVRGGEQSEAFYSLLPGSRHPGGEIYKWHDLGAANSSPVTVDMHRLMRSVRMALVASVIARHWIEGQRNSLCQAFSGFLWRAHKNSMDTTLDGEVPFEYQDAERLLSGVMEIADDAPEDRHMRMLTLKKTWDKAEEGAPVTGANKIKEVTGDENVVSLLYMLLANSPDLEKLDSFFQRYAYWRNTSNIFDMDLYGIKGASGIMSVQDMRNTYKSERIARSDGTFMNVVEVYLNSPRRVMVDRVDAHPLEKKMYTDHNNRLVVNKWIGIETKPIDEDVKEEDVKGFLDYLYEIIADRNRDLYEWVLAWCCDMFQDPIHKKGTALVLVGKTGSGKSSLGVILRSIIGENHSMQTNSIADITNNFNADSCGQLLIQGDEVMNSNQRKDANRLKSMIADPTRRMEPKGIDAQQIRDFARYLLTSNEMKNAVALVDGIDDRRYTITAVSHKYSEMTNETTEREKREYWNSIHEWGENPNARAILYKFLLTHPYDRDILRRPFHTKTKDGMIGNSLRGVDAWIMDMVSLDHPFDRLPMNGKEVAYVGNACSVEEWPEYVLKQGLVDAYNAWRKTRHSWNGDDDLSGDQIIEALYQRDLLPDIKPLIRKVRVIDRRSGELVGNKVSKRIYRFPSRKSLVDYASTFGHVEIEAVPYEEPETTSKEKEEF